MNTQDSAQESARTTTIMPLPSPLELANFYVSRDDDEINGMQRVIDTYIKPLYERIKELEQVNPGGPEGLYLKVVPLEGYQVTEDDREPGVREMVILLSEKKAAYLCAFVEDIPSRRNEGWTHIIAGLGRAIKKLNEQADPYKEEFESWFKHIWRDFDLYPPQSTINLIRKAYHAGRAKK